MSRLVAFGCSYTRGTGLDDVWDFKNNCSIFPHPSKYAWPQLIADKLNIECVNLGKSGYSNKAIWHKILNFEFRHDDLIFIHWSYLDRYHFFEDKDNGHMIDHKSKNPRDRAFFKFLHSDYDMFIDMYMRANHIDSHLAGKTRYQLQVDLTEEPSWNNVKFLDTTLNQFKTHHPRANDGSHPGILAHQDFANSILQKLGY